MKISVSPIKNYLKLKSSFVLRRQQTTLGPKIDIDTVDAVVHTPSSSSNHRFEEFSSNMKARSTPRKKETAPVDQKTFAKKLEPYFRFKRTKEICKKFLEMERGSGASEDSKSVSHPLPSVEQFLEHERGEICKKCCREVNPKRPKFHQKAFNRTKSLFAASKKKINVFKEKGDKPKMDEVLSGDSDPYCTPEHGNSPYKTPEKPPRRSSLSEVPYVPEHRAKTVKQTFNYNAPLPQSPQRRLLECTPPKKSPLHLKIKLSPKRLFGMGQTEATTPTPASPILIPAQGNYKSFEDHEQNLAATMGEILANLRELIEGKENKNRAETVSRVRKISTSSEVLDHDRPEGNNNHQLVNVLLHHQQEPDYAEISPTQMQQQQAYIKKFSPEIQRIERNNNEYIMVNNDPTAIYATVVKKYDVIKSKSLSNLHTHTKTNGLGTTNSSHKSHKSHNNTPSKPIRTKKKGSSRRRITFNVQPSSNTSVNPSDPSNKLITRPSTSNESSNQCKNYLKLSNSCSSLYDNEKMAEKSASKHLFGSDQCIKVSVKEYEHVPRKYRVIHEKYQKQSDHFDKEVKQIAYDTNIMDQYLESLTSILNKKLVVDDKNIKKATEDFLLKEIEARDQESNSKERCEAEVEDHQNPKVSNFFYVFCLSLTGSLDFNSY